MLPQSMLNLCAHVYLDKRNQNNIFSCMTRLDFQRLLKSLSDLNQMTRKAAARLICQLVCDYQELKQKFLKKVGIQFNAGNVLFSIIEDCAELISKVTLSEHSFAAWYFKSYREIIQRLKTVQIKSEPKQNQKPLCWFIDPNEPTRTQIVYSGYFPFSNFIDPAKVLFGFVSCPEPMKSMQNCSIEKNRIPSEVKPERKARTLTLQPNRTATTATPEKKRPAALMATMDNSTARRIAQCLQKAQYQPIFTKLNPKTRRETKCPTSKKINIYTIATNQEPSNENCYLIEPPSSMIPRLAFKDKNSVATKPQLSSDRAVVALKQKLQRHRNFLTKLDTKLKTTS